MTALDDQVGNAAGPVPRGPAITDLDDQVGNAAGPVPLCPAITLAGEVGHAVHPAPSRPTEGRYQDWQSSNRLPDNVIESNKLC
jgi:hypothetical protein